MDIITAGRGLRGCPQATGNSQMKEMLIHVTAQQCGIEKRHFLHTLLADGPKPIYPHPAVDIA